MLTKEVSFHLTRHYELFLIFEYTYTSSFSMFTYVLLHKAEFPKLALSQVAPETLVYMDLLAPAQTTEPQSPGKMPGIRLGW